MLVKKYTMPANLYKSANIDVETIQKLNYTNLTLKLITHIHSKYKTPSNAIKITRRRLLH
uniref:Uncharacterized protein n=1 Tax=Rhizophora mucronata TaxID=61149 RepID=A0A2P2QHU0_RHIMU